MSLQALKADLWRACTQLREVLTTRRLDRVSEVVFPFGFRWCEGPPPELVCYDCGQAADVQRLLALGMVGLTQADHGAGNCVWLAPGAQVAGLALRFERSHCHVVVGPGRGVRGSLRLCGHHSLVLVGASSHAPITMNLEVMGEGNAFVMAQHATTWGSHFTLGGEGRLMALGEHAMLAMQTALLNHDLHPMFFLSEPGQVINPPRDQLLFPHVWLARQVQVVKADIGYGAIIGTMSLVNRDVAPCTLVAGIPARVLRTGVSFDRAPNQCQPETLERLKQYEAAFSGLFPDTPLALPNPESGS